MGYINKFTLIFILFLSLSIISANEFGYNYLDQEFGSINKTIYQNNSYYNITYTGGNTSFNQTLTDSLYIAQSDEANLNVNSSDYWDNMDTINSTQMEDNSGQLNIKESWFTTLWDAIFGTKTTDDLIEGTTNLYDNQSWNESRGNEIYSDIKWGYNMTYSGSTYNATYDNKNTSQWIEDGNNIYNKNSGSVNITSNLSIGGAYITEQDGDLILW